MGNESVFYKFCLGQVKDKMTKFKGQSKRQMDFRKKQQNNQIVEKSYSNITIFKDTNFRFLYQKTERLSTAIYLITNLMVVDEPIKWQLRKVSLNLLDSVMSLSNANLASRNNYLQEVSKKLFHLISLYEVSFRSGFISQMNYEIVNNEMQKLANFVSEYDQEESKSRDAVFGDNFFNQGNFNNEFDNGQYQTTSVTNKTNNLKDTVFYKGQSNNKGQSIRQSKTMSFTKRQSDSVSNNKANKTESVVSQERQERRGKIINIIKQKGVVSVKDISNLIKDTSEKTIQRELISLVDENVLLKAGERRWSRYSML